MKKISTGLVTISIAIFLLWIIPYTIRLILSDPNQPLFNELFRVQYQNIFCGQAEKEMTAIAQKYILVGSTEHKAVDILKKNGFAVNSQKGDGIIQSDDHVQGTREEGNRLFYILIKLNNDKAKEVISWVHCGGI